MIVRRRRGTEHGMVHMYINREKKNGKGETLFLEKKKDFSYELGKLSVLVR